MCNPTFIQHNVLQLVETKIGGAIVYKDLVSAVFGSSISIIIWLNVGIVIGIAIGACLL